MKGITFNIQKFSIHDGPGVRTTVFLKGCPLRCKWCANPESQEEQIQIMHDQNKCIHCLQCIQACNQGAIGLVNNTITIDESKCIGCLSCIHTCLQDALEYEGDYKSVEEVVAVCLQDLDFYEESNGGVTISGGEGMMQSEFVEEILLELKKHHIHTAIETTGYIPPVTFRHLAKLFDLLLFDVKHYDANKHIQGTGVSNELIIENLQWAIENGIEVLPRIPVIPDFNDSLEDARGIVELFNSIGVKKVQLLPFHQFGERKYELLKRAYPYHGIQAYHKEDLLDYQKVFLDANIHCFF